MTLALPAISVFLKLYKLFSHTKINTNIYIYNHLYIYFQYMKTINAQSLHKKTHNSHLASPASRMATMNAARKSSSGRTAPLTAVAMLQSTDPDASPNRSSNRAEPVTPRLSLEQFLRKLQLLLVRLRHLGLSIFGNIDS